MKKTYMKLVFSEKTLEYERKDDYVNAMKQTYREWQENKTDENLCKALLEYFFVLYKLSKLSTDDFPEWKELTEAAYERMEYNRELSFFVGYAMYMGFYLIPADRWGSGAEAVHFIEDHGKELMEASYEAEPDCTLFKLHHCIYWGDGDYKPTDREAAEMREKFPIPSVINEYFRRILDSDTDEEENLPRFETYYCAQIPTPREGDSCKLTLDEIFAQYMDRDTWIKHVTEEKQFLFDKNPILSEYIPKDETGDRCRICGKKLGDDPQNRSTGYYEPESGSWICEDCCLIFKSIFHWSVKETVLLTHGE